MYDCIIIGAGPAGLSAGLYAARSSMKTLIIEKQVPGGLIAKTDEIANYPGTGEALTGPNLIKKMVEQVKLFGANITTDTVVDVDFSTKVKKVICKKQTYETKSVIIATGSNPRLLNVPGEKEFTGKGVCYCATCDAPFFEGLDVYVVGAGEAAVEEAMYLTKFARKVTLLVRKDKLSVAKSIEEKALKCEKLSIMWNVEVEKLEGEGLLNSMTLITNKTKETKIIVPKNGDMIFGVFIFIGYLPETSIFENKLEISKGYIVADERMKTSVDGVFVAGDVRVKELRQVVTAVNDGAIAAVNAGKYVESLD